MRLCMPCTDRPGLLLDISQILLKWRCNFVSVEVEQGAFYLDCQIAGEEQKTQIMQELQQVEGIYQVSEVLYMPSKERVEQLKATLTAVQAGRLAVSDSGTVKCCRKAAGNMLTPSLPVSFTDIVFASPAMERVLEQARRYAAGSAAVLIRGETGTGKALLARALHSASPRAGMTFLPVSCATIPDILWERHLFGYEAGAFTGAAQGGKPGLFELANGGTLFLDDIGAVPVQLQAKLMGVLQEKRVRRLGGSRGLPVDVRLIAATHRDLAEMLKRRLFREDLYYRLNVLPLCLPPLRERTEDIPRLVEHFVKRFAAKLDPARLFSPEAMEKLQAYSWPGNVRELENSIARAVKFADGTKKRFSSSRRASGLLGLAVLKKVKNHGLGWSGGH